MLASQRQPANQDDNNYVHSLPPFANDENKALSKRIKELEAKLTGLVATIDDNQLRADSIMAHMKNVQSESNHTQVLIWAN
jgi:UDP-glucose:O-linked fucose beta-1,3-glucosyltransferase